MVDKDIVTFSIQIPLQIFATSGLSIEEYKVDIATILGALLGLVLTGVTMWMASGGQLLMFIDIPSVIMVIGGALCAVLVQLPLSVCLGGIKVTMKILFASVENPKVLIEAIVEAAETARKGSVLALEKVEIQDEFLAKMIRYLVDGYSPDAINQLIDLELFTVSERHSNGKAIYDGLGEFAPAFGMIGTVIGLIVIMANLSDPDAIGPGIAVALITTLYGALFANLFFIPMSKKLKFRSTQEQLNMEIVKEGINSIINGENPRAIKLKLASFLSPGERESEE